MLIDSHCHLDFPAFDADREEVLASCRLNGIEQFIVPSVGPENWQRVLKLGEDRRDIVVALGIHPCFLSNLDEVSLSDLEQTVNAHQDNIIALGEMGLDRRIDVPLEKQQFFLMHQLKLAKEKQLPVILHSVRTNDEVAALLKNVDIDRGVVHGFTGSGQQAARFWEMGIRLGVGGAITYSRAQKTKAAIAAMPLEALLLETDSPDMPLAGHQGQRNDPQNLPLVLEALCALRSESTSVIERQLRLNTCETFNLDRGQAR